MKLLAAILAVLTFASSSFAAPQVLSIAAQDGPIRITPIFHGSLQIEYQGLVIHVDPFSKGNYSGTKEADIILITHTHPDHLDKKAIAKVTGDGLPDFVAPEAANDALIDMVDSTGEGPPLSEKFLKNGQTYRGQFRGLNKFRLQPFTITAVPMYNLVRGPKPGQKFHPKGQFNGYVLTLGGKRIYIAGDTEFVPEMKNLKNIDVAFLPMNLPYTMTPQEAANAARAFKPKMAVPYHYRYPFDKPNSNPQQFAQLLKNTKIQVKLLDWYQR